MSDASTGKISTKLVTLTPATYDHWCSLLKDLVFALANVSSIDGITPVSMLRLDSFAEVGKIPPGAPASWLACGTSFALLNFPGAAPLAPPPTPGIAPVFGLARRVTPPIVGTVTQAKQQAFDALELTNAAWYQVRKDAHKEALNRFLIAEALKMFQHQQALAVTAPVKSVSTVIRDDSFDAWVLGCYSVAISFAPGRGFNSWVYILWDRIKFSLSEQVRAQVASVPGGDVIGLLSEIRIALYHVEELKPHLLRNSLLCSKFEVEGAKDVLVYIAFIKNAADRLAAVGKPISDEDLQNVLVMGLPSVHFSETLQKHEKGLCQPANGLSGFAILCSEIKSYSARPSVAAVLRSLKHTPGGTLMAVQGAKHQSGKVMLDQYVAALVAVKMQAATKADKPKGSHDIRKKSDKPCFAFQKGECERGPECRFSHDPKDASKSCKLHGPGHTDEECQKQRSGPGSRPESKKEEESKYHRLLMAIEGCQLEDYEQAGRVEHMAMMTCGITAALTRYTIIIDDCATVHCSNDLNMAVPGTLRKTAGVIHGLGDFDVTHCFDTRLSNILDPDNPHTPQLPLLLSTVFYHPRVPFKLVISRGLLKDAGFLISIKDIADAVKPPPGGDASLKRRGIVREVVRTTSGCHVISGQTDPISGLHCAMLRDEQWAIPIARREKFESSAIDGADASLALPTAGVAIGELKPQVTSQSLPRQRSLAEAAVLEQVVARHVTLNHTCGFRTISTLLGVPCPGGLKCLGCGAGAPKETPLDPLLSFVCSRRSEMFSADWVPVPGVPSFGGHTGYFMIIDVWSKKLFLIPAESQQAWCAIWEAFVAVVEVHERSLRAIAFILTDGALCFEKCERCAKLCREHGIQQVFSPRNNQKQNKVEGGGRHPKKVCNILMLTSGFSEQEPRLWADVLKAVNVSYDLIPPKITSLLQTRGLTKFELWHGVEVPWETLVKRSHPVGCLTLVKTARADRAPGFGEKVDICAFLYHEPRMKSHKLWNIEKRDYQFNAPTECDIYPTVIPLRNSSMLSKLLGQALPALPNGVVKSPSVLVPQSQAHLGGEAEPLGVRRSARPWVPSQGFIQNVNVVVGAHTAPSADTVDYCLTVRIELGEVLPPQELQARTPRTLREAFQSEDAPQWKKSLLRHFAVLDSRKCFGPASTERPAGKVFPVRVLFKFKTSIAELFAGSIPDELFKTRSVLPGDRFVAGQQFDKDDIAAEQIHPESFRMMMIYCVTHGKISVKCDAVEAFIGAEMVPRGIMCSLPQGYDPLNPAILRSLDAPTLYAEVRAAIPGCPQGSKLFQNKAVGAYKVACWKTDPSDNMVFKKKHDFQKKADLSGLYVDDIYHITDPDFRSLAIFLGPAPHGIGTAFPDMKYELMTGFLGMQMQCAFTPYCRSIFICNSKGVGDLLLRLGYMNRKPARTPMVAGCIISKKDCPPLGEDGKLPLERRNKQQYFCGTNMHLNYFGVTTRPDIKFTVRLLATVQSNPGKPHFEALDHLLCYMLYTRDLVYGPGLEFVATPLSPKVPIIKAFADSSHKDCADTFGSTQSTVTTIAGAVIASRVMVSPSACASIQMSEFGAAYNAVVQTESQPEIAALIPAEDDHSAKNPEVSLFMAINNSALHGLLSSQRFNTQATNLLRGLFVGCVGYDSCEKSHETFDATTMRQTAYMISVVNRVNKLDRDTASWAVIQAFHRKIVCAIRQMNCQCQDDGTRPST